MEGSHPRGRRQCRRLTGTLAAAFVAAGLVSLAPTAQGQDDLVPAGHQDENIYRDNGRALGDAGATPADSVRAFLEGRGLSRAATASLRAAGPVWKARGVSHLRMEQYVAGLRVHGSYVKAAFTKDGALVDLIENVADVPQGAPRAADVDADDALRAAVGSLHPGHTLDTSVTRRQGNVTIYAKSSFYAGPRVEKVAVPTEGGDLAVGYLVETWTAGDNLLHETLVGGDGTVVESVLRTAEDGYSIFPEHPEASAQQLVTDPADAFASPSGWLAGDQTTTYVRGNNARAYLDTDNDNAPDSGGAPVTDGVFDTAFSDTTKPSTDSNKEVAAQNLFYLNNLIHDTLYRAGFTEAVGNFQEDNFGKGGRGGDPVAAEAQDGGGTDNANFATPRDGRDPRMQMYLWSVPGMYEVNVTEGPAAGSYDAGVGEWAEVTAAGVSGPLALGDDGTGTTTDACEPLTADMTGKVVIVDRGSCPFIDKARNVQAAGATGMVVANNVDGAPFTMGGSDRRVSIASLMVSRADGDTLKTGLGSNAILRQNPNAIMRDGDLDSDIVWHEYGHGLTWRMIGRMDGPLAGAVGEGMSDVLALVANGDDRVGEYSASDPLGIRSEPYDGYSRTYGDLQGSNVHFDGEVYAAIGWDLVKRYDAAGLSRQQLLADIVDGMNYTPAQPSYEEMRDGILAAQAVRGTTDRSCLVWGAFAKFGVGEGAQGVARGSRIQITESFVSPCG